MKKFIGVSRLTLAWIFSGCSGATHGDFGLSTIDSNGSLNAVAIEYAQTSTVTTEVTNESTIKKIDVILLPQADGKVSAVFVADDGNEATLDQPWQKVETKHLDEKEILSQEFVESKYDELLKGMPKEPNNYHIHFKNNSTDITDEEIVAQIVEDIKSNSILRVDVIGYTDRAGDDASNKILSMKRAEKVVEILKNRGIDDTIISFDYYGEGNTFVETEDGVANELNRRAEVTLK